MGDQSYQKVDVSELRPIPLQLQQSIKELLLDDEDPCSGIKYVPQVTDGVGKPQVWVRLRPSPRFDDNIFEIGEDKQTLRLLVDPRENRLLRRMVKDNVIKESKLRNLTFRVDGVLSNSSQEETYSSIVDDVINKAMTGTSGMIILIGPEVSGKSFTLFGYPKKYEYRGIIPRTLEKMFHTIENKRDQVEYKILLAIVEIRQNRIKDLLTMGTSEILRIGKNGPQGMCFKEITSIEQGLSLLMLAIAGQKGIPREDFAKFHTIIYFDIHGKVFSAEGGSQEFDSRIIFSKIASMPPRMALPNSQKCDPNALAQGPDGCPTRLNCLPLPTTRKSTPIKGLLPIKPSYENSKSCCLIKHGPVGEAINVRRDLFMVEQMFIRSNEIRKLNRFYAKVEKMGMLMLMKRPNLAPSQYFRQCKLAHCLQDIVSGTVEIRILLTIRPEKIHLHSTLEAMRFATKVKCVPIDIQFNSKVESDPNIIEVNVVDPKELKEELLILHEEEEIQERLVKSPGALSDLKIRRLKPSLNRQRIYEASDFLEGRIDEIKILNKEQVKVMFETIRQMWQFAAEHQWQKKKEKEKKVLEEDKVVADENGKEPENPIQTPNKKQPPPVPSKTKRKRARGAKDLGADKKSSKRLSNVDSKRLSEKVVRISSIVDEEQVSSAAESTTEIKISRSTELLNEITENLMKELPPKLETIYEEVDEEEEEINEEAEEPPAPSVAPRPSQGPRVSQGRKSSQSPRVSQAPAPAPRTSQAPRISVPVIEVPELPIKEVQEEQKEVVLDVPNIYTLIGEKEPSTKEEAWTVYLKTMSGLSKFEELKRQNNLLLEQFSVHNEISQRLHSVLTNLTKLLRAFNGILEETSSANANTNDTTINDQLNFPIPYIGGNPENANNNLSVPTQKELMNDIKALESGRDELNEKMNLLRSQAIEQKKIVELRKLECESEFKQFCQDHFSITIEKGEPIIPVPYSDEFAGTTTNNIDEQEEIVKHYEDIRRTADRQAKELLRWYYSTRPAWHNY